MGKEQHPLGQATRVANETAGNPIPGVRANRDIRFR